MATKITTKRDLPSDFLAILNLEYNIWLWVVYEKSLIQASFLNITEKETPLQYSLVKRIVPKKPKKIIAI